MKTIKVIDLANMIANKKYDKMPKKIKIYGTEYELKLFVNEGIYEYCKKDINQKHPTLMLNINEDCLNEVLEIIEDDILDDKEREYLSAVISPFRDKIQTLVKMKTGDYKEYISIKYFEITDTSDAHYINMYFPNFSQGTMYKGMKLDKEYTLEELGL